MYLGILIKAPKWLHHFQMMCHTGEFCSLSHVYQLQLSLTGCMGKKSIRHVASPELLFGSSHLPQRASHASPGSCCPQRSPGMRPLTSQCFRTASASGICTVEIIRSAAYTGNCLYLSNCSTGCSVSRPIVSRLSRI